MIRALVLAIVVTGSALLSGCGFTPLYATPGLRPEMAAIDVNAPRGRTGYLLTEALNDTLGRDRAQRAAYRLDLTLTERRYARGLRLDNTADRYEAHLIVDYALVDLASGRTITHGAEPVEVSYAATYVPYDSVTAEQDGQKRAAELAAQRLFVALSAYFAGQSR